MSDSYRVVVYDRECKERGPQEGAGKTRKI